jgi:hypothetical protein
MPLPTIMGILSAIIPLTTQNRTKGRNGNKITPEALAAGVDALSFGPCAEALELVPESEKRAIVASVFLAVLGAPSRTDRLRPSCKARSRSGPVRSSHGVGTLKGAHSVPPPVFRPAILAH